MPTNGKETRTPGGAKEGFGAKEIPECHTWVHPCAPRNLTCQTIRNVEATPKSLGLLEGEDKV